ncbi:MAG TPA: hypothetical protein VGC55_02570 [Dokdonella sp.]
MMRTEDAGDPGRAVDWASLPLHAPSADLWSRIAAAQALREQQARRRRMTAGVGGAMAAAVLGAAVLLLPQRAPSPQAVADDQRESRTLESQWQHLAASTSPSPGGLSRLRLIDATLQAAYDRGAHADELAPLWRQRNEALRGLIAQFQTPGAHEAPAITRI